MTQPSLLTADDTGLTRMLTSPSRASSSFIVAPLKNAVDVDRRRKVVNTEGHVVVLPLDVDPPVPKIYFSRPPVVSLEAAPLRGRLREMFMERIAVEAAAAADVARRDGEPGKNETDFVHANLNS